MVVWIALPCLLSFLFITSGLAWITNIYYAYVANLSTKTAQTSQETWIFSSPAGGEWSAGHSPSPAEGSEASRGLKDSLGMLSRQRRVTRRQFPLILQTSRSWHSDFLSLRIASRPVGEAPKTIKATPFAFVVSHKVAVTAVDRNKLKRRARAIVRELLPKIKDNYACLLFFKKAATQLSYQELNHVIQDILAHSNVISF